MNEEKIGIAELQESIISLAQQLQKATEVLEGQNHAIHFLSNNLEALLITLVNKDVITTDEIAKEYDQVIKQFNQGGLSEDFKEGEKPVNTDSDTDNNTSSPKDDTEK
jgi:selenophosphate synthetase-related protein